MSWLPLADRFDNICSKRLRAAMDVELLRLYQASVLSISATCHEKLLKASPATMDRLRARYRSHHRRRRGFTKPGTLLKHHIPIRTWADWTENRPGFCEIDLVDHSGGQILHGREHAWILCFTDVKPAGSSVSPFETKLKFTSLPPFSAPASGCRSPCWASTPTVVPNSSTISSIGTASKRRSPSPAVGPDERTSAYVEQKNWSVVRRAVGYFRYDSPEQLDLLNTLYARLHFCVNFFLPVMKVGEKVRFGNFKGYSRCPEAR